MCEALAVSLTAFVGTGGAAVPEDRPGWLAFDSFGF